MSIDVKEGKVFSLSAPLLVNGVDGTVAGSQVWETSNTELVLLTTLADGSAELTPVGAPRGVASVSYKGKAIDASGVEVPTFGSETYNIIDADVVVVTPVQVAIISTEKV